MNGGIREIEERAGAAPGTLVHPDWSDRWPWLVQGITTSESGGGDFALFGQTPAGLVLERWTRFIGALPVAGAAHARQVHGAAIRLHREPVQGLHLAPPADGHLTRVPGLLLAVSVADCVPVYVVDPQRRAVAMVHAGWRGVAAGILEVAVRSIRDRVGTEADALHVHLGPSICGDCYEVGLEVHTALGETAPDSASPVDLRAILTKRALGLGVPPDRISRSALCTLCGGAPLYSHRGGNPERQVAYLGVAL
jgi:YfiH family protein